MKANIRKVAELAGVSTATVSRALSNSNKNQVSPKLYQRILTICEDLHYAPNKHSQRMFTRRSNTVAFLVKPSSMHYDSNGKMDENIGRAITGTEEILAKAGMYLTLTATNDSFLNNKKYLEFYRSRMVDGFIVVGWCDTDQYIYDLIDEKIPTVLLHSGGDIKLDQVNCSNYEGMRMMLDQVAQKGHRQIGVIAPSQNSLAGKERMRGIMAGVAKHKLMVEISDNREFDHISGYYGCKELLERNPNITCLVCSCDIVAIGAIKAANEMGKRVPDDISITGADGMELYGIINLTTFMMNSYSVGKTGTEILLERISNPAQPIRKITLPVEFIQGETLSHPRF